MIYSIILRDRLAVILSLLNQPLRYYFTNLMPNSDREVDRVFDDLFATLNPFVTSQAPLRPHQQLYDWLIRPVEADLAESQVKALVFVMDGVLQGLLLAALHDGQQYLIEPRGIGFRRALRTLTHALKLNQIVGGVFHESKNCYKGIHIANSVPLPRAEIHSNFP